jgi:hypothetical protein
VAPTTRVTADGASLSKVAATSAASLAFWRIAENHSAGGSMPYELLSQEFTGGRTLYRLLS